MAWQLSSSLGVFSRLTGQRQLLVFSLLIWTLLDILLLIFFLFFTAFPGFFLLLAGLSSSDWLVICKCSSLSFPNKNLKAEVFLVSTVKLFPIAFPVFVPRHADSGTSRYVPTAALLRLLPRWPLPIEPQYYWLGWVSWYDNGQKTTFSKRHVIKYLYGISKGRSWSDLGRHRLYLVNRQLKITKVKIQRIFFPP